jgi:hypothetical protein
MSRLRVQIHLIKIITVTVSKLEDCALRISRLLCLPVRYMEE